MSFFDEGDESRTRVRPGPRPRRTPGLAGGSPSDQQTLLIRRGVAAGAVILVVILLVVGINGCLDSRKKSALKSYNSGVAALVSDSDETAKQFFALLTPGSSGAGSALDLQTKVNDRASGAALAVKRAQSFDVPDEMKAAQTNLLLTLELRSDALAQIAKLLPTALGKVGSADAVKLITGQMQAFLASDVVYSQRVIPDIKHALAQAGVGGQTIANSRFFPSIIWLDSNQVAARLGTSLTSTTGAAGGTPTPGTHGHGLDSTSVQTTTLTAGAANRITAAGNVAFTVKFTNQGENDEHNVVVKVTVQGGSKPLAAQKIVPLTNAGAQATTTVPLGAAPPIGVPVTVAVEIVKVPGEKTLTNNKATYPAIFTR